MSDLPTSPAPSATALDRIEAKLDRLQRSLDRAGPLLDQVPDLLSTLADSFDALAAHDGHEHFDQRLRRGVAVLVRLCDPAVLEALERLLDPRVFDVLAAAAAELPNAAAAPSEDHGLFGLMGVIYEDEVQRALSFAVHFLRRLGRVLDERERLPAAEEDLT